VIPVPPGVATLKDIDAEPSQNYKFLLYNELRFCNRNADYIRERAKIIYEAVTVKKIPMMVKNCCDFKHECRLISQALAETKEGFFENLSESDREGLEKLEGFVLPLKDTDE
jgi:hypothetical protein